MASKIEWKRVRLQEQFDPAQHLEWLKAKIAETLGEGWELDAVDMKERVAHVMRRVSITEVDRSDSRVEVTLRRGIKPSDGDKTAARLEDANPGMTMTVFDPHLGRAVLESLPDRLVRARGAIAVALGVKPWQVQVSERPDGGVDMVLPNSYVPSRHDERLAETATTVVGREGWYVRTDPAALTGSIIPSDPPTFPAKIDFPLADLGGAQQNLLRFGRLLPDPGAELGEEAVIDFDASPFALLAGTPGSGKSILLNALIAEALAGGSELAIVDLPAKAVDFLWCKDLVRPGGWGCDSLEAAVTAVAMIYAEGERRARVLAEAGVVNWTRLPEGRRFRPIFAVVDEVSALLVPETTPKGIPKDHPLMVEVLQINLLKATLARLINKVVAEMRFAGIRMVLSTQVVNNTTGVGPSLKAKIGHKLLQGSNPSKQARSQAFNDESAVPSVPGNVRSDSDARLGVGVAELEGVTPAVFKGYFARESDYRTALDALGVPTTDRPSPTPSEIARHTPSLADSAEAGQPSDTERHPSPEVMAADPRWDLDDSGERLSGFERANQARRLLDS